MTRCVPAVVVVCVALGACGGEQAARAPAPDGPRLTPGLARTLDARFRTAVSDAGIPGASAAIMFPDGREWTSAVGSAVLHPPRPMTPRTSISFDNVTNVATAALGLRLVEQGRLRLDDRISRWYPAWRGDARATLRDLLGHTSGLGDPADRYFLSMLHHHRAGR